MQTEGIRTFSQHNLDRHCYSLKALPALEGFEGIVHLWETKKRGHLLPAWSDFKYDDFLGIHSRISVSEKEENDFRFRVYGSELVRLLDQDLTNKLLCASIGVKWKGGAYAYFEEISQGPCIGRTQGFVANSEQQMVPINAIDLPMGEDGENVSHCLHFLNV
ncbi:hypothetical protein [Kiloniella sp.]|uniref:hypothetical protein n=1 Tax=Kiloniella sp. TaxID=1938587 RepID=UPI003B022F13